MEHKGMYSIIVDEGQFVERSYDFDDVEDNIFYSEPKKLINFKKRCVKAFGKSAVIQYGGGQLEIIVSEDNFVVFQQIIVQMFYEPIKLLIIL
jgi:hypothetical protein